MKAFTYVTILTFGFIVLICNISKAQTTFPTYEAGVRLSGLVYQGDLSPAAIGSYKTPTLGVGVFVTRNLNRAISVRANLDYGKLSGNDAAWSKPDWRQQRNLKFKATTLELSAHLVYNLKSTYSNYGFAPYIFGGAGVSFLNIKRDYSDFNYGYNEWPSWVTAGLAEDIQHTPPKLAMVLPVGAGFKHPLSDNLTLFGEASYRIMFTDYLDGFSKSGDPKDKDHYSNISVGLTWRLGNNGISCPTY
jgi:hypothetical protein